MVKKTVFFIISYLCICKLNAQINERYIIVRISYDRIYGDNLYKDDFGKVMADWDDGGYNSEYGKDIFFNIQPRSYMDREWAEKAAKRNYEQFKKTDKILAFDRHTCESLLIKSLNHDIPINKISDIPLEDTSIWYALNNKYKNLSIAVERGGEDKKLYINSIGIYRYVFLPFKEVMKLRHLDANYSTLYGIWIEPKDFAKAFGKYGLLELRSEDIPYLTPYALEINPSFACVEAETNIEKAICHDKFLSSLDRMMAHIYKKALKGENRKGILAGQREWLMRRDQLETLPISHDSLIAVLKDSYIGQLRDTYRMDFSSQEKIDRYEFRQKSVASFDCEKAVTPVEKLICQNDTLAYLDMELHEVFAEAKKIKPDEVLEIQREWLEMRDAETAKSSGKVQKLKDLYEEWLYELMYYVFVNQPPVYNKILKTP